MDRADIERHILRLESSFFELTRSEIMHVVELRLLLKIFDCLDQQRGMLDSIDSRLESIDAIVSRTEDTVEKIRFNQ